MKYLIVINSLGGGGAERIATSLANYWVKENEVHIMLLDGGTSPYTLDDRIVVQRLFLGRFTPGPMRLLATPLFGLELLVRRMLMRPERSISFLVRSNLVNVFSSWFERRAIISERTHVAELYGSGSLKHRLMLSLIKMAYKRLGRCIAISHGIKSSLIHLGVEAERVDVIHNPIRQSAGKKKTIDIHRSFSLVTVGRLIAQKNQGILLTVVKILRERGLDVRLTILGEGPLKKDIEGLAEVLDVSEFVTLPGFSRNIETELNAADLFVFSSQHEGFGNVLIEAMAEGLPVISTDCPYGPREIIAPETLQFDRYGVLLRQPWNEDLTFEIAKNGILTRLNDADGMAEAIAWLLGDPDRYEHFSERSVERAKNFDLDEIAKQYQLVMDQHAVPFLARQFD